MPHRIAAALNANRPLLLVRPPDPPLLWLATVRAWALAHGPLRAPHSSVSMRAMYGDPWRPGELSLARGGVLVLDDAGEFFDTVLRAVAVNRWSSAGGRSTRIVAVVPDLDSTRTVRSACLIPWTVVQ